MKEVAKDLGIDTARLEPVVHEGCKYEGANPARAPGAGVAAQPDNAANTANSQSGTASSQSGSSGSAAGSATASPAGSAKLVGNAAVAAGGCKKHWFGWLLLHGKSC